MQFVECRRGFDCNMKSRSSREQQGGCSDVDEIGLHEGRPNVREEIERKRSTVSRLADCLLRSKGLAKPTRASERAHSHPQHTNANAKGAQTATTSSALNGGEPTIPCADRPASQPAQFIVNNELRWRLATKLLAVDPFQFGSVAKPRPSLSRLITNLRSGFVASDRWTV